MAACACGCGDWGFLLGRFLRIVVLPCSVALLRLAAALPLICGVLVRYNEAFFSYDYSVLVNEHIGIVVNILLRIFNEFGMLAVKRHKLLNG